MTDIKERLRNSRRGLDPAERDEAAEEIARLRETVKEQMREVAALRAALDRAADALEFYDNKAEAQKARRALEPKP